MSENIHINMCVRKRQSCQHVSTGNQGFSPVYKYLSFRWLSLIFIKRGNRAHLLSMTCKISVL